MTDASRPTDNDAQSPTNEAVAAEELGTSFDQLQPETQGDTPLDAELGVDGQGDLLTEDEPASSRGDAPDDLRVEDLP